MSMRELNLRTAADGKVYLSYAQVHETISSLVEPIRKNFQPDVIISIAGGGACPSRVLRTQLKIPILTVALELYDDNTNSRHTTVRKTQWFDETTGVGQRVRGKRVLIVDEVDDTRTTLAFCVEEIMKTNAPAAIAVAVVHNKLKPKLAQLPDNVLYFAGADVPDKWNCYPWDAAAYTGSIYEHERLARFCAGEDEAGIWPKRKKCTSFCIGFTSGTLITAALFLTVLRCRR
uniref:Phosphoribosyltransferase domain-containing protein n=1 Tax=Aureoumbra lagunensis TaxID=44058 RepID=A0A7S3NGJ0_9STRA|mmetsp:Transcript_3178/g.4413  ORF Transcript_3178/g.4413 Transcript_3178/m.4413 type:complete len:232 (-) Transcript_3178:126-821(-)